ncbi:protein-L-isoaspartate(D-aspartate) O-methyltransferase [Piscinibacter defluvii]|uniref:protein-L-isoaspartate(D-aspartate) O-methyltransferase n=1 Tax=Piscinibacter defluvii TaxID=1796922 RepID=UPI001F0C3777|nr:protein-L-isoaspartate(D-aspartate) O-methyltransferase [Piscinibacter defluvii]
MTRPDNADDGFAAERERMVVHQIEARGIADARVLAALRAVPREAFVPTVERAFAYEDHPLPIGAGQTISQPYIVALTTAGLGLRGGERVLEIGTGCGYAAAVLGQIAAEVHSVERIESLAAQAREHLAGLGIANVHVHCADGSLGWPAAAPYDAIAVTAAGPEIPAALKAQLAPGGVIVMPVGDRHGHQELLRWSRGADGRERAEPLCDVRFVPLLGAQGFTP